MIQEKVVDIGCIVFGMVGAFINLFLFWVTVKQRSMNEKFAFLFKNLAVSDFINAIIIPVCWYHLSFSAEEIKSFELADKELTFLTVTLCTISVGHPLIFLIGFLRYKILTGHGSFLREFSLRKTRLVVSVIWICCGCCSFIPLIAYWISVKQVSWAQNVLPRIYSTIFIMGACSSVTILLTLLVRMARTIYLCPLPISSRASIKTSLFNVLLFLVFTVVFSILPTMFCIEMIACGPNLSYKSLPQKSFCSEVRTSMFHDVKLEFSLMFLSLCLMSIANGAVFLLQPSLRSTFLQYLCCKYNSTDEQERERISAFVIIDPLDPLDLMKQEIEEERAPSVLARLRSVSTYGTCDDFDDSRPRCQSNFLTASMRSDI